MQQVSSSSSLLIFMEIDREIISTAILPTPPI